MADVRLIDANELIDWLTRPTDFRGNCEDCTEIDCIDCIIENAIKYAPTVNAAPVVHGRWIDTSPNYRNGYYNNAHKCSNCGDYYTTDPNDLYYCPRCGAKMDLEV